MALHRNARAIWEIRAEGSKRYQRWAKANEAAVVQDGVYKSDPVGQMAGMARMFVAGKHEPPPTGASPVLLGGQVYGCLGLT